MRLTSLLLLCSLFATRVQAQFNPEKYFSDSISFSFEVCYKVVEEVTSKKKKKEEPKQTIICVPQVYTATVSQKQLFINEVIQNSKRGGDRSDMTTLYYGNLSSLDLIGSTIKQHSEYGSTLVPVEIYKLSIFMYSDKPRFTSESKVLGKSSQLGVSLYFTSFSDAQAAKYYLQKKAKEAAEE